MSTIHNSINETVVENGRRQKKKKKKTKGKEKTKASVHRVIYLLRLLLYLHHREHFIFELHNSLLYKEKETS